MGVWSKIVDLLKKGFVYGATALTGYEIGNKFEDDKVIEKQVTTVVTEKSSSISIESVVLIVLIILMISTVALTLQKMCKCIVKFSKKNSSKININSVQSQQSTPRGV